ncbi:MAG TPA: DUF2339 domain-containing protein, partial [Vicinamibacteria bacterium]
MEGLIGLLALGVVLVLLALPVVALVALARSNQALREVQELRRRLASLERPVPATTPAATATTARPGEGALPASSVTPPPVVPREARTGLPPRNAPVPAAAPVPPRAPSQPPPSPRPSSPPPPPRPDFATNLGPKILVGAGGLAVVFFLAFFVRYAWENDWVGPTGRVLSGAAFSLGLIAIGLRIIGREYRPLGQGLAAAGFAGLYITAFAAHAVYDLLPRAGAAAFMVAVTACAVLVAERLDTRLLASLAWIGGYLAPVLLSTGEDRAMSLFAYLLLLGAGAVWLDRRKPWGETMPLAVAGTLLLYAGWYAQHFRPERFEVAAGGLVALTALFGLGSAGKAHPAGHAGVLLLGALGLAQLGLGADRPEVLLVLSLGLAFAARRAAAGLGGSLSLVAAAAVAVPFAAWALALYRPESLGLASAWVVGGALLLALGGREAELPA